MAILVKTLIALAVAVLAVSARAIPLLGQGTWEETLKARNINGVEVPLGAESAYYFYDTVTNTTWLRNWDPYAPRDQAYPAELFWGVPQATFGGYTDWRLPHMIDVSGHLGGYTYSGGDLGYNVLTERNGEYNEFAYLYYVVLGNRSPYDTQGNYLGEIPSDELNTGYFSWVGFRPDRPRNCYWGDLIRIPEYPDGTPGLIDSHPYYFCPESGRQGWTGYDEVAGLALVRTGDVLRPIPEPATLALVGAALLGVMTSRRRGLSREVQ